MTNPAIAELRELLRAAEGHSDALDERYAGPVARLHYYAARALPLLLNAIEAADGLVEDYGNHRVIHDCQICASLIRSFGEAHLKLRRIDTPDNRKPWP